MNSAPPPADAAGTPPAQMTMAEAIRAGAAVPMGAHAAWAAPAPKPNTSEPAASAFPPDVFVITGDGYDEPDDDYDDTSEDTAGYDAWALTDDSGQDLAGLSAPMFDVVVADDVGDPDCFYSAG